MSVQNIEMPQEQAQTLYENGAILIFLDVPIGTEFGIDYNSWLVGEKFKGIKMIPPGFHFIYYSARSKGGDGAPRSGFMHFFKQKEILYKQWDAFSETIMDKVDDSDNIERFILNKQELDQYLGAYPYNSYKKWLSLTSFINENIVQRVNPLCKIVTSATPYISPSSNTETRKNAESSKSKNTKRRYHYYANQLYSDIDEEDLLPNMDIMPGSQLIFSHIPRILHPDQAQAVDITTHCLDRSYTLDTVLQSYKSENAEMDLLGEIQLAFICFIIGQVFDAFEHWKRLLDLLSSSLNSMTRYPRIYSDLIFILHFQIKEIPEDFFTDIVSKHNFLLSTLTKFFANIEASETPDDVKTKAERFKSSLQKKFDWVFDDEDEENLPVVVEL